MNNSQISLDAKDFFIILAIAFSDEKPPWTYQSLAATLGMSPSQVHASVRHLMASGLLNGKGLKGKVDRGTLADFIVHGARFAFPPVPGRPVRGIPTAMDCPLFEGASLDGQNGPAWVWPNSAGHVRGTSLAPLHPSAPGAALRNPGLYRALAHFDALRVGQARERDVAEAFFRRNLEWAS